SREARPLRKVHGRECWNPRPRFSRDRAILRANPLTDTEVPFTTGDPFCNALVSLRDADLREAGIHIEERAAFRAVVFFAPDPQWHRSHDEQVSGRTAIEKIFQRHPQRT